MASGGGRRAASVAGPVGPGARRPTRCGARGVDPAHLARRLPRSRRSPPHLRSLGRSRGLARRGGRCRRARSSGSDPRSDLVCPGSPAVRARGVDRSVHAVFVRPLADTVGMGGATRSRVPRRRERRALPLARDRRRGPRRGRRSGLDGRARPTHDRVRPLRRPFGGVTNRATWLRPARCATGCSRSGGSISAHASLWTDSLPTRSPGASGTPRPRAESGCSPRSVTTIPLRDSTGARRGGPTARRRSSVYAPADRARGGHEHAFDKGGNRVAWEPVAETITVRGAREHNLRNVDLELPATS